MESITFMLMPGFSAMAFFSAIEPLRIANRLSGQPLYRWQVRAPFGQHAEASNGMQILADAPSGEDQSSLIVCAGFEPLRHASSGLLGELRRTWRMGASLGAIDTGAFLLAEAGVLGDETITLHWEAAATFRQRYPRVPVSNELYESHARLFTCAGGTAAMDMMLNAIATRHGLTLATAVAEQLIHDRIRSPEEAQRMDVSARSTTTSQAVIAAVRLMERNLAQPLSIDALAQTAGAGRKRMERHFRADFGVSPARYYLEMRLRHARDLLRDGTMSLAEAAALTGFSSQSVFSRACKRVFGAAPRAWLNQVNG